MELRSTSRYQHDSLSTKLLAPNMHVYNAYSMSERMRARKISRKFGSSNSRLM